MKQLSDKNSKEPIAEVRLSSGGSSPSPTSDQIYDGTEGVITIFTLGEKGNPEHLTALAPDEHGWTSRNESPLLSRNQDINGVFVSSF